MRKFILIILVIVLLGFFGLIVVRFLSGDEDTWICSNGQWIKHGNPTKPQPQTECNNINSSATPTSTTTQEKSTEKAIIEDFSDKYDRPKDAFIVKVGMDTGMFAKGTIRFKDEMGGGLWFAAKTDKGWELAFDGNGIMTCDIANKYNFPVDMIPNCIDAKNNNQLIQR
jgi:hypothetical protein